MPIAGFILYPDRLLNRGGRVSIVVTLELYILYLLLAMANGPSSLVTPAASSTQSTHDNIHQPPTKVSCAWSNLYVAQTRITLAASHNNTSTIQLTAFDQPVRVGTLCQSNNYLNDTNSRIVSTLPSTSHHLKPTSQKWLRRYWIKQQQHASSTIELNCALRITPCDESYLIHWTLATFLRPQEGDFHTEEHAVFSRCIE